MGDTMYDEIDEYTPDEGANLVEIDEFSRPGDCLSLVGHYDTRAEAEKALAEELAKNPRRSLAVYSNE